MNNLMELNLKGEAFTALRDDFDSILNRTIATMQMKHSREAAITLKLNVSLVTSYVPSPTRDDPNHHREVEMPRFNHKISSVMQIKSQLEGVFNRNCELIWNEATEEFLLVPINDGQLTLIDEELAAESEYEYEEDEDGATV